MKTEHQTMKRSMRRRKGPSHQGERPAGPLASFVLGPALLGPAPAGLPPSAARGSFPEPFHVKAKTTAAAIEVSPSAQKRSR